MIEGNSHKGTFQPARFRLQGCHRAISDIIRQFPFEKPKSADTPGWGFHKVSRTASVHNGDSKEIAGIQQAA